MKFHSLDEWLSWQESAHPVKIDMGLERTRTVALRLGLIPASSFLVTIAGTNGKGSSVTMLEGIMRFSGYSTGAFTSPHIHRYNERIKVNGEPVSDELIVEAFEAIETLRDEISLSYFEFGTLAALYVFRKLEVDIVILEVGLGGRLDSTNIMDTDIALVTSIGIDHVHFLGDDRNQIALEKGAIARAGKPVISAEPEPPHTMAPFFKELGADYIQLGKDFSYQREAGSWRWEGRSKTHSRLPLPALPGEHQFENISGVLAVCEQLPERLKCSEEAIHKALQEVRVPGRFERHAGNPEVIYDVAHNHDAMTALASMLREHPCSGRTLMVLGVMADKDLPPMLQALEGCIHVWVATRPDIDRALDAADLAEIIRVSQPQGEIHASTGCEQAWQLVTGLAEAEDRIVIAGSFYTVAEIRGFHL